MISNEQIELITERLLERLSLKATTNYLVLGKPVDAVVLPEGIKGLSAKEYVSLSEVSKVLYYTNAWTSVLRIAELVSKTDDEECLVEALLSGKSVEISIETAYPVNRQVHKKIDFAIKKLKEYGVEVNKQETVSLQKTSTPVPTLSTKKKVITIDTLMNEYDINQISEFKVESNMIVTALAKDYLREHQVTIV